ncbi:MAG: hypothetical protein HQL87_12070 [Magnetococcales bacterium]|nr:hypothetical protein [Magnetococcales bacterium]
MALKDPTLALKPTLAAGCVVAFGKTPPLAFSVLWVAVDSVASTAALSPSAALVDVWAVGTYEYAELIAEMLIKTPILLLMVLIYLYGTKGQPLRDNKSTLTFISTFFRQT